MTPPATEPRIVSLIASATEIVCALGARDQLVGRSHECDFPESVAELPICSHAKLRTDVSSGEIDAQVKSLLGDAISIYGLETETIDRLRPTHLVTQSQCDVCAVSLRDVQAAVCETLDSSPEIVVCEPNSLADIWEDIRRVGRAIGKAFEAERLVEKCRDDLEAVGSRRKTSGRPRVACIEWTEPMMAAGNWVPELVELSGGQSVVGSAGEHSPWLTIEQLAESDPDVVVVMPCGFDLARTVLEAQPLINAGNFQALRSACEGKVFAVDGNAYFNRPGPRVVDSAQMLAEIYDASELGGDGDGIRWTRLCSE